MWGEHDQIFPLEMATELKEYVPLSSLSKTNTLTSSLETLNFMLKPEAFK